MCESRKFWLHTTGKTGAVQDVDVVFRLTPYSS